MCFSPSIIASSSSTEAVAYLSPVGFAAGLEAGAAAGAGAAEFVVSVSGRAALLVKRLLPRFLASSGELASWLPR